MSVAREMPRYQCHKLVWALKIAAIDHIPNPDTTGTSGASSYGAVLTPAESGYEPFEVSSDYMNKHQPEPGGYYVVYDDGYKSYSPAKAFEDGYAPTDNLASTFARAVGGPQAAPSTVGVLNTGQPAIKGYRNLSQAEIDLMNDIKAAGEQVRDLVQRVNMHIQAQPPADPPHSQVTNPGRWAAIGQTDLQTGLMALTRAVAQPTSF